MSARAMVPARATVPAAAAAAPKRVGSRPGPGRGRGGGGGGPRRRRRCPPRRRSGIRRRRRRAPCGRGRRSPAWCRRRSSTRRRPSRRTGLRVRVLIRLRRDLDWSPDVGERDHIRAGHQVADPSVRVREQRNEQPDDEAPTVDEQQQPADQRASDATGRALPVDDPQTHDQLADTCTRDALQQDELEEAGERGDPVTRRRATALPRVDARTELRALPAEPAVAQRLARARRRARVHVILGQGHGRDEDPGEEQRVDDVRDDSPAHDRRRIALRLHSVGHTASILPHRAPRAGGCRAEALW